MGSIELVSTVRGVEPVTAGTTIASAASPSIRMKSETLRATLRYCQRLAPSVRLLTRSPFAVAVSACAVTASPPPHADDVGAQR